MLLKEGANLKKVLNGCEMMKQASFEPTSKNSILVEVFLQCILRLFNKRKLLVEKSNFAEVFSLLNFYHKRKRKD